MAGLSLPNDTRVGPDGTFFGATWIQFFAGVWRKLNTGSQVATVATADATDLASAIALANSLKAQLNALIAAQQA